MMLPLLIRFSIAAADIYASAMPYARFVDLYYSSGSSLRRCAAAYARCLMRHAARCARR